MISFHFFSRLERSVVWRCPLRSAESGPDFPGRQGAFALMPYKQVRPTQHDATRRNPVAEETCEKVAGQKVQDHTSIYKPIAGSLQDNTSQLQIIASPLIAPGSCQMLCNCRWTCGACGGGAVELFWGYPPKAILDAGNLQTAWSNGIFVEFCWHYAQVMLARDQSRWAGGFTMTTPWLYISLRYPQVWLPVQAAQVQPVQPVHPATVAPWASATSATSRARHCFEN